MRVALTAWNGRISPVLDVARQVEVLEVEEGLIARRQDAALPGGEAHAQAEALLALRPEVLICGAISRPLAVLLAQAGVRLFPFTAGEIEAVAAAWLAGELPNRAMTMPGCGGRRMGRCGGGFGGGAGGYGRRGCRRGHGGEFSRVRRVDHNAAEPGIDESRIAKGKGKQ